MKNGTLDWLRTQCSDNLLTEKWLLCDSLRTGQTWKDRINLAGTATVNLHSKTLRSIALSLVSEHLATSKLIYVGQSTTQSLIQDLIDAELEKSSLPYFSKLQQTAGLAKLAARSIRDLRMAGIEPDDLCADDFESSTKAADLKLLYVRYLQSLRERSLVDYAACLSLAMQELDESSCRLPSDLLLLEPYPIHLTRLEQQFVASLRDRAKTAIPPSDTGEDSTLVKTINASFFAGYGEVNEVRGVVQQIVGRDPSTAIRFDDVEIIYTADAYVPLIYELLEELTISNDSLQKSTWVDPPVTFSDGIASIYSRPGRALRAWLRWIKSGGLQSKAVQMVREGVLNRPKVQDEGRQIGYSRLAASLRQISIGFKLDRYRPAIKSAIDQAKRLQQEVIQRRESDDGDEDSPADSRDDENPRDFGLPALNAVLAIMEPAVTLAPTEGDSAASILKKAKRFLLQFARCENKLDRSARRRLLDDIDARLASLDYVDETADGVLAWLEALPIESPILGSGPQPGCVYASPVGTSGYSGRKHVYVLGMDANRFPRSNRVDPMFLDSERKSLSAELETSTQLAERNARQLTEALQRFAETEGVHVSFSFSTRNLVEDRDQAPSSTLVELFREAEGKPDAHLNDLLSHVGTPVSFSDRDSDRWLTASDGRLAEMVTTIDQLYCESMLESRQPHFRSARLADEQRNLAEFNEFDGHVEDAGPKLSPTNLERKVSPSRMETFGTCPRRFFFKYGLGVFPPDEWDVDPERWLDPITLGNLVHGLFEKFMRELTASDRVPELKRDLPRLMEMLDEEVQAYLDEFPSPNLDAFQLQKEWLVEACEIFLEKEQAYCQETGARPWVLEAAIGLDEDPRSPLDCRDPIELGLKNGQVIRLGGRIDRVDRMGVDGSESYAIWDYKSGSDWGYSQEDPFQQGRKLQSFLYVGMLRHRLAAMGKSQPKATSFGYFFPNSKTLGRRIQWTAGELKRGDAVLQDICNLIQNGVFPATTESGDCKFCDFKTVCQDLDFVAAESVRKATETCNDDLLGRWKKLREL